VLAQRLVRRLCPSCRQSYSPNPEELPIDFARFVVATKQGRRQQPLFRAVGCRECYSTGYSGRIAIFELLPSDAELRQLCTRSASANEMKNYAVSRGFRTLRQSGWNRVLDGQTSIDEVERVCAEE